MPFFDHKIDNDDFEDICKRNASRLIRSAYRITRNQLDAEELANEAFLVLWKKMHGETIKNPDAYLTRILVNLIGNYLKSKSRQVPSVPLEDYWDLPAPQDPEERIEDGFPPELTDAEKEILNLRIQMQLSYDEIAKILQISTVSCRSRFFRAKAHYAELIKSQNT